MSTFDIKLPAILRPKFPDRCVGCEAEHPGRTATIKVAGPGGLFSWEEEAVFGFYDTSIKTVKLEIPACPGCAAALERRHFWKSVALYLSGFGAAAAMVVLIVLHLPTWLAIAAGLLVLLLPVIWELKYPPAFTITPLYDTVNYEFRSSRCAHEFMELNQGLLEKARTVQQQAMENARQQAPKSST